MIEFGKQVRDISTGFEGSVVARCEYITGAVEYGVRPTSHDSTRPPVEYIEETLLEVVGDGFSAPAPLKVLGFVPKVGDAIPSNNSHS